MLYTKCIYSRLTIIYIRPIKKRKFFFVELFFYYGDAPAALWRRIRGTMETHPRLYEDAAITLFPPRQSFMPADGKKEKVSVKVSVR